MKCIQYVFQLATQMALEKVCQAYTTARQEVSILQTVHHPHIVPLLGFSRRPLALLLALAPMGSLQDLLEKRHKEGLRLPVFVIKQVVIQVRAVTLEVLKAETK